MVLDLMEEFRPLIADNLILSVITHKEIKPTDFTDNNYVLAGGLSIK